MISNICEESQKNFISKNNNRKSLLTYNKFFSIIERNKKDRYIVGNAYLISSKFIHKRNTDVTFERRYVYILNNINKSNYLITPIKCVNISSSLFLNRNQIILGIIPEICDYKISIIDLSLIQNVSCDRLDEFIINSKTSNLEDKIEANNELILNKSIHKSILNRMINIIKTQF